MKSVCPSPLFKIIISKQNNFEVKIMMVDLAEWIIDNILSCLPILFLLDICIRIARLFNCTMRKKRMLVQKSRKVPVPELLTEILRSTSIFFPTQPIFIFSGNGWEIDAVKNWFFTPWLTCSATTLFYSKYLEAKLWCNVKK